MGKVQGHSGKEAVGPLKTGLTPPVRGPKGAGNSPFSCAQLQPLTKIAPALLCKPI
jgi:hypothetical protein